MCKYVNTKQHESVKNHKYVVKQKVCRREGSNLSGNPRHRHKLHILFIYLLLSGIATTKVIDAELVLLGITGIKISRRTSIKKN